MRRRPNRQRCRVKTRLLQNTWRALRGPRRRRPRKHLRLLSRLRCPQKRQRNSRPPRAASNRQQVSRSLLWLPRALRRRRPLAQHNPPRSQVEAHLPRQPLLRCLERQVKIGQHPRQARLQQQVRQDTKLPSQSTCRLVSRHLLLPLERSTSQSQRLAAEVVPSTVRHQTQRRNPSRQPRQRGLPPGRRLCRIKERSHERRRRVENQPLRQKEASWSE